MYRGALPDPLVPLHHNMELVIQAVFFPTHLYCTNFHPSQLRKRLPNRYQTRIHMWGSWTSLKCDLGQYTDLFGT